MPRNGNGPRSLKNIVNCVDTTQREYLNPFLALKNASYGQNLLKELKLLLSVLKRLYMISTAIFRFA